MTPVSIVKIVASASLLVAVCSAALVFGIKHVQRVETAGAAESEHGQRVEMGAAAAAMSPSELAPSGVRNEGSPALAATEAKAAALVAELAQPQGVLATDQSRPSFDVARIDRAGEAVIAGRAAPDAVVDLLRDGQRIDRAVADASGQFVMVPQRLPAGSYELSLSAKSPDGTVASSKQRVAVTVNDVGASSGEAQSHAEYIPEAASRASPPVQSPVPAAKPRESVALKPAQANAASSASEEGPSSAVAPRTMTKIVSRGDCLWRISRLTYGDGTRYMIVYRANRDRIRDPNLIRPGQTLILPMHGH
jgi:nucleoid-associated protein YgaU